MHTERVPRSLPFSKAGLLEVAALLVKESAERNAAGIDRKHPISEAGKPGENRPRTLPKLLSEIDRSLVDNTFDPNLKIIYAVSAAYGCEVKKMLGKKRGGTSISFPRQVAMFLLWTDNGIADEMVGTYFKRDRTTVIYARELIQGLLGKPWLDADIAKIRALYKDKQ